jgi:hypothetical protein
MARLYLYPAPHRSGCVLDLQAVVFGDLDIHVIVPVMLR